MTQLSLTYTDTVGSQRSIDHLNQNFQDIKTFLNGTGVAGGGNLDATNTGAAFAKDNVEPAFASWKPILSWYGLCPGTTTAATYVIAQGHLTPSGVQSATEVFQFSWLDPADYVAGSRATKYRIKVSMITNDVAPAANLTFGLYPVTSSGTTDGLKLTFGTVVSGSTALFTTPAADAVTHAESSAFTAPAAGMYAPGLVVSAGVAAGSYEQFRVQVQYQQV